MRIGIDGRMFGPKVSGIGIYVKNLIINLLAIDKKNEYVIFLLPDGFDAWQTDADNVKKVLVKTRWYSWGEQFKYWRTLEKEKTDIMHFPNFNVPLLFTRKFLVTIHDMTPWYFPGHKRFESNVHWLAYATVFNSAVKRAEKIITVSQFSKDEIIKKYAQSREKIEVVYNGANLGFQRLGNYGIISLKERYGITKPYIFFIGVWRDHKNIGGLLRAYKILKEKYQQDLELVLGGENNTSYKNTVIDEINKLGISKDVIITGFIPDEILPNFYQGAEICVIPSFIEGFGLHAIESLALGTPVAASKTTSLPEIIGDASVYFNPHEPKDISRAIMEVLNDPSLQKNMLERGERIIKKYSWHVCAEKTLDIYNKIFQKSGII